MDQILNQSVRSDGSYGPEAPPIMDLETNM